MVYLPSLSCGGSTMFLHLRWRRMWVSILCSILTPSSLELVLPSPPTLVRFYKGLSSVSIAQALSSSRDCIAPARPCGGSPRAMFDMGLHLMHWAYTSIYAIFIFPSAWSHLPIRCHGNCCSYAPRKTLDICRRIGF